MSSERALDKVKSKYDLVIAVTKRAKQLADGRRSVIATEARHPVTIALMEIEAGEVRVFHPSDKD